MAPSFADLPAAWPPAYPAHEAISGEVARSLDREAEQTYGVPSIVLMEHASAGVAAIAAAMVPANGRFLVLCGPGNNGGDGYGAARFLRSWGRTVRLLRCNPHAHRPGDTGLEVGLAGGDTPIEDAWGRPELVAEALRDADVAIDALFGVGLTRDLEGVYPDWIRDLNAASVLRLAVDVPSGLDADNGLARPVAVRADVTATMAMPKTGLVAAGTGAEHAGLVVEVDIGLPGPLHRPYALNA